MVKKITEKQKREIIKLRAKNLSYNIIAKWIKAKYKICISRQRIHQITSGYVIPNNNKWLKILSTSIKKRDRYCCQWAKLCDGQPKKSKELVVHHLDFNNRNNNPSNLITLCSKCHGSYHSTYHINDKISLTRHGEIVERIKIKCKYCGKKFRVTLARKNALYCSYKCFGEDRLKVKKQESLQMYNDVKNGMNLSEVANKYKIHWATARRIVQIRVPLWTNKPKLDLMGRYSHVIRKQKFEKT